MNNLVIDQEFRVNIYLDTNILVDYIESIYSLLNRTIDYLKDCPCVTLRSSHYVLYEYTEVRKYRLFINCIKKEKPNIDENKLNKSIVKKTWKVDDFDYNDCKEYIQEKIQSELNKLKGDLNLNFDEHVLHRQLVYPTNSLCLNTKISKEDCLVMISCMFPNEDDKLSQCILLTRDEQYYKAFNENKTNVEDIFNNNNLNIPQMIRTENLEPLKVNDIQYNLYQSVEGEKPDGIESYWNELIKNKLKENLGELYIGETYEYGIREPENKCIYFKLDNPDKELKNATGLCFISPDLTKRYSLQGPFEFWNKGKVKLPYKNPEFPKFSFMPQDISPEKLSALRQAGVLVFYDKD